ncbi:polysaccharide deacetylase family sporulation protein PdaB [Clostridium tetani]|uniref:Polysaccharide deacetylase family sporulation protein PdaB n=1 Tax=Clostridium tetani TaxID=1513 RepID=A0A4Q0VD21_CLOTA|nr:polysaccharide deacetylase family sporulation protein PdaB [Clostridium tetani]RXI48979.1 polysaccharide deacetylase family sporulation protein PdaB [Clostridium tetani]RXI53641.1 polysaccharide deacetylase family sporulation protein PdaB [Clostridium tetani]RXI55643.1 polysaccharide deacetylase family sporulation protein PdaB [Clostridium tetani]RXM57450.1 polysaccharide deacetylase family sporulation protein PdaB [Clostridium tetani]
MNNNFGGNMLRRKVWKKVITSMLLLVISAVFSIYFANKSVFFISEKKLPIYSVDTKEKKAAITFDVNWGDDNTKAILETLDEYEIKATFFLIGNWIDDYPEQAKEIYKRGHEIGNHSNAHPDMAKIPIEKIKKDINIADGKIFNLIGGNSKLFRFPSGSYNDNAVKTVEEMGYYCIQWDVDSIDWKEEGEEEEYSRVMKKTKPGSIILFHSDSKYTPKTLPRIIKDLKEKGYEFVKIGELIYKEDYNLDANGRQIKK